MTLGKKTLCRAYDFTALTQKSLLLFHSVCLCKTLAHRSLSISSHTYIHILSLWKNKPPWLDLTSSSDSLEFPAPRILSQLLLSEPLPGTFEIIYHLLDLEILYRFFPTSYLSVSVCIGGSCLSLIIFSLTPPFFSFPSTFCFLTSKTNHFLEFCFWILSFL